jgi:DNA primase
MNGLASFDILKANLSLRDTLDQLGLAHRGRSMQCPNRKAHQHGDQTRSAYVSPSWRTWHCHACGAGGSVIDLYAVAHEITLVEAGRALEAAYGLGDALRPLPRPIAAPAPSLRPASTEVRAALETFQAALTWSDLARQYLEERGILLALAVKAGLGFARRGSWPNERGDGQPRIIAPVTTPDGTLLTLYGRSTFACAKYLRHDFLPGDKGIFNTSALKEETVVLTEGVFDALAVLAAGKPAAALCGLSMREEWWQEIAAKAIILAVDADEAGQLRGEELTKQAVKAGKRVIRLEMAELEGCKDLNEYWVA